MCEISYKELEEIQVSAAYALFLALKDEKVKNNISSIDDFWDLYIDRKNDYRNSSNCGVSDLGRLSD